MGQTLYIMQGVPGSGKSTLARTIAAGIENSVICSTDDYFMVDGVYKFDAKKLGEYHAANLQRTKDALDKGMTVLVDNTNTKRWECKGYCVHAQSKNIPVVFVRVQGGFTSLHGVPSEAVKRMLNSQETLTMESVLASKSPYEK